MFHCYIIRFPCATFNIIEHLKLIDYISRSIKLHLSIYLIDHVVIGSDHMDILSGHEGEVVYMFDLPQPHIMGASCTRPPPIWNFGSVRPERTI